MYRLSDAGWRKHKGNMKCFKRERTKCHNLWFLYNFFQLLQLSEMPSLFSVAVFNDMVYWSDTHRRSIQAANKLTGKNRKVLLKRPGQPFDLKVRIHAVHITKCHPSIYLALLSVSSSVLV